VLSLLLDENLPRSIAARLRTFGFDVVTVIELQARGAADSAVLLLAIARGCVPVTRDLDSPTSCDSRWAVIAASWSSGWPTMSA